MATALVETLDTRKPGAHRGSGRIFRHLAEVRESLAAAVGRGLDHWILAFSGGKDSTTTIVVALETALKEHLAVSRIDVVYADTLVEIPVIREWALEFLQFLDDFDRLRDLPLFYHILRPPVEERFWVCILGKGYPPPHQRFRWCTRRLKIEPVEAALRDQIQPGRTAIITGVRFGESVDRDRRMNLTCRRGGECGQGSWSYYSQRLQAVYLSPIAYWGECDVWDFLNFVAPHWGYPTNRLESDVYNGRETRFGCWMCTVVRQDKAMEKITATPKWEYLRPLLEFRQRVLELTNSAASRYVRPDGKIGRLSLDVRRTLLKELLRIQEVLGMELIEEKEVEHIRELWDCEKYRDYGHP